MRKMLILLLSGVLLAGISAVFAHVPEYQKDGYYDVVKLYVIDKDYKGALSRVEVLLTETSDSAELYLLRGQIKVDMGDKVSALADFDKSVELDPKNDEILYYRAALKFDMGDMEETYVDTSKCIHLNPNSEMCYILRSMARRELGDMVGASEDSERARAARQNLIKPQNSVSK